MRAVSPRDAILILLGAASMHVFSFLFSPAPSSIVVNTHLSSHDILDEPSPDPTRPRQPSSQTALDTSKHRIPHTALLKHAPGWTIFQDIYMANGTFFVVTTEPETFPNIALITSTGLPAFNTPESIAERMPTANEIAFISPDEARRMWGGDVARGENDRIYTVEGSTLILNDPDQCTSNNLSLIPFLAPQMAAVPPVVPLGNANTIGTGASILFIYCLRSIIQSHLCATVLNHYYHFCAELFYGVWAFWTGTFSTGLPPFTRAIFPHATALSWRDSPGMNTYFLRAAFPSMATESQPEWADRVAATAATRRRRAWHFPTLLLVDRSASFRGQECGERTQRTAAEAIKGIVGDGNFLPRGWWEPVRRSVLDFAGISDRVMEIGDRAFSRYGRDPDAFGEAGGVEEVVVTYITRQGVRRHLVDEDHERLVSSLEELCVRRGWELNVVPMEKLSKEEQLSVIARTTFLVGVHGNGLTHLIMMPVTPISMVVELFYPGGYAHDYEWTARSLGMKHFAVWNDTSSTFPDFHYPAYPEGFQGTQIPVYGPHVAKLIEDRADGLLP
ncbi:hypothetical protein BV25DRAFT_1067678 [Artomyces pyxidatus]|uniref:Uncharacterized protein n=1 Tax=Artomyces pyxidatus TaxID=48021 RepID=A0ACB8TFL6_9AGAM|nr:hypothetical protein BV25DRAFT_1067678 [Artomyces pyxidatus]